ncbi:uncharacterized protein (TIGR02594 family) [Sphingomonas jinjuensis]|uniref:Uncharacterized protein (TIGR02594 family) n=1 Tax=Sphingomonas jinjuensis TaxID=535907 RepID=A0A840FEY8_9SPHN|nr:TIGR02594 family protein [Sphingomonas jinjuensis]MBB4154197.1 uncharacterized protein (TIGR02594 family) [Sphingomonas jinjuensis]
MAKEPAWLIAARAKLGTREAAGALNNPTILGWAKRLGAKVLGIAYNADSVPWCGLFAATCMTDAGITPPPIALRAKSWADWQAPIRPERLAPGAVLVFQREGGGHVGFYLGETQTHYEVLGGNQGDCVSIVRIAKSRCIARRWPRGTPVIGGPVWIAGGPARPTSNNEA